MANLIEKKKLSMVSRDTLLEDIAKYGFSKALTVGDIKKVMELHGIVEKYTWKQNAKGYYSAWS